MKQEITEKKKESNEDSKETKKEWGDDDDSEEEVKEITEGVRETDLGKSKELEQQPTQEVSVVDPDVQHDKNIYLGIKSFEELGLSQELLNGIYAMNYVKPSKIQEFALPFIFANRNLIAQTQSGTGKTASIVIAALKRSTDTPVPQTLILCPTRELSRQIYSTIKEMGKFTKIKTILVVPKEKLPKEITEQIIVGTPGRVVSIMKRNLFDISKITTFVLDEADLMLDKSGLGDSSKTIRQKLNPSCLVLLFATTFEKENTKDFAISIVPKPRGRIELKTVEELKVEKIQQLYFKCKDNNDRLTVLTKLYTFMTIGQVIIFVATRNTAQMIMKRMLSEGLKVSLLHGQGMDVSVRDSVIDKFRDGKTRFLITTY